MENILIGDEREDKVEGKHLKDTLKCQCQKASCKS